MLKPVKNSLAIHRTAWQTWLPWKVFSRHLQRSPGTADINDCTAGARERTHRPMVRSGAGSSYFIAFPGGY